MNTLNNHHHPPDQSTPECAAIAAQLPLLDDDALTPHEAAQVRAHLAGCSACQAQHRAYSRLDGALRRHFGPSAFAPLRVEEIMERLPASDTSGEPIETTPLPPAPQMAVPQPPAPRRSRRILSGVSSIAAVLIIALFAALIFTNRPHPTPDTSQNHANSRTITQNSLTGISMVSPDEGWMVGGTSTFTYVTDSGSSSIAPPTPSSSTPGVLIGVQRHTALTSESGQGDILLYHYKNGAWTQVHVSLHVSGIPHLTAISMDSPTDGWAVGGSFPQPGTSGPTTQPPMGQALLLHYDGATWKQVNTTIPFVLGTVDMLSASDGWALTESNGSQTPEILHYDGGAWTSQPLPASLASLPTNKQESINFTGFSALPDGEAWAGAVLFPTNVASSTSSSGSSGSSASSSTTPGNTPPGQFPTPSGVILHYIGGSWSVQASFANAIVNGLAMAGPDDGWATGQDIPSMENTNGQQPQHPQAPTALVLRYSGGQWSRTSVPLPGDDGSTSVTLTQIKLISSTDIWMLGMAEQTTTSMVVQGSQGSQSGTQVSVPQGSLVLLHYDGTSWTSVPEPALPANALPSLADAAFTSPTNGWAVGTLLTFPTTSGSEADLSQPQFTPLVLHYSNGVWSRYTL